MGSGNVTANELPREDLALCDDPGRVARQAVLPKCDTKGILEHASGMDPWPICISRVNGEEARQDGGAARAPGAGAAWGATDPWDTRRAGKCPRSPSPLKSCCPNPPPSPPRVAAPQRMVHDTEASRLSQPRDGKALGVQEPGAGGAGPEARPVLGEGNAHSPLARKKAKTTPTSERCPFEGLPWGFTGPKPR
ncbi:hypothetical protein E2562_027260 [Oryza meyeriana var. granulata]|uniref:Uncharacterized protein n=1 Tax=Oryza meyeriana var. granulata TaxID=110450 RepID=A0A6G1CAT2_9ORYZ|nr:hypothetical protein E2562_027260 [Oryza meyeriana var. granulata]